MPGESKDRKRKGAPPPLSDGDRADPILKDDISAKSLTFCPEGMLKKRDVGTHGAVNLKIFNSDGIQSNAINPP